MARISLSILYTLNVKIVSAWSTSRLGGEFKYKCCPVVGGACESWNTTKWTSLQSLLSVDSHLDENKNLATQTVFTADSVIWTPVTILQATHSFFFFHVDPLQLSLHSHPSRGLPASEPLTFSLKYLILLSHSHTHLWCVSSYLLRHWRNSTSVSPVQMPFFALCTPSLPFHCQLWLLWFQKDLKGNMTFVCVCVFSSSFFCSLQWTWGKASGNSSLVIWTLEK